MQSNQETNSLISMKKIDFNGRMITSRGIKYDTILLSTGTYLEHDTVLEKRKGKKRLLRNRSSSTTTDGDPLCTQVYEYYDLIIIINENADQDRTSISRNLTCDYLLLLLYVCCCYYALIYSRRRRRTSGNKSPVAIYDLCK